MVLMLARRHPHRSQQARERPTRWVGWWLLLSMAFAVFAPSLGQAISLGVTGSGANPQVVAVCTTNGLRYVPWPDQDSIPAPVASHECLLCCQGVDSGPPPKTTRIFSSHSQPSLATFTPYADLRPTTRWITPDTRAPPVFPAPSR